MNSDSSQCHIKIALLSQLYDINKDKFNHIITNEEINNFNICKKCKGEIMELCIHHLLSSYHFNSRQGYLSSLVLFNDYLKSAIKPNSRGKTNSITPLSLLQKRVFFIPVLDKTCKWSLAIIDSFSVLLTEKSQNSNRETNEEMDDDSSSLAQFKVIFISFSENKEALSTLLSDLEKLFMLTGEYEELSLAQREIIAQERDNAHVILLPKAMTEFESALVLMKVIFGGIKANSVNLFLASVMNTEFNAAYLEDLQANIFIETQRILHMKFINKQESKFNKPPLRIPLANSKIKEIKIIFSGGESKSKVIPIYKKAVIEGSSSMRINLKKTSPIVLTERNNEHQHGHMKQLLTELDQTERDDSYEDDMVCQTEPGHVKIDSWPFTPERKMKEIKLPLIRTNLNLNPTSEKVYKRKVSRNNMNYLSLLAKDTSILSQPNDSSSNRMSRNFVIDLLDESQRMAKANATDIKLEDVLERSTEVPRKSNKKGIETKSTMSSQLLSIRDYSKSIVNDPQKEDKDDPCNGCDLSNNTNCILI